MAEWGKLYGSLHGSPKWRRASKGARALWTTAMSWCIDQESSDGEIPADMLKHLDGTAREAESLVTVGLWDCTESGWHFHDWDQRQRTHEQIARDREAAAERQRRARARRAGHDVTTETNHGVTNGVSHAAREEESREEESREKSLGASAASASTRDDDAPADAGARPTAKAKANRGQRIPQPFVVSPDMVAWARENTPGLDHRAVTARFVDYWTAIPGAKGVKLDWAATWRNWLRKEHETTRPATTARPPVIDQWRQR